MPAALSCAVWATAGHQRHTILRATGAGQRTLVVITGSGSPSTVSGTTRNITNNYVPVGARSFNVDSTSGLAVGDRVFVRRFANDALDPGARHGPARSGSGGAADDVPWTASGYTIDSDRIITRIEGNRITVDAPITCAIEAQYGGGTIRKFTWSGRIQNCRHRRPFAAFPDYVARRRREPRLGFRRVSQRRARLGAPRHLPVFRLLLRGAARRHQVGDGAGLPLARPGLDHRPAAAATPL